MMSSTSQSMLSELIALDPVEHVNGGFHRVEVDMGDTGLKPMTPRELDFIEDLNKNRDKALSPRQKAWLDKIWRKVFS